MTFESWLDGRTPVCSYARITSDREKRGEAKQIGVGRQHTNHADPAAESLGWAVVMRYSDNNLTAADPDIFRPAFHQMVRDLRARQTEDGYPIYGLIAVEDERVYRLPEDYLRLYRALTVDEEGCLYYTDKKHLVDVHAESEQTRGLVMSSVGEQEVKRVKRRTTRNAKDRALEGKGHGGTRRFGWNATVKDERGNIVKPCNETLDPTESPYLRKAIEMKLALKGWNTIAKWLLEENVPTVRGGTWTPQSVSVMLCNPSIFGGRMINGELLCDPKTGEPVIGAWETLATYEEWSKIFAMKYPDRDPKKKKPKGVKTPRKHESSSILRCGWVKEDGDLCLHGMVGRPPYGAHKWGNYVCNAADCRRVSRRMDKIDAAVSGIVVKVLEAQFAAFTPEAREWHGEATLARLRADLAQVKDAYKAGTISLGDYIEFKDDKSAQIEESERDRDAFHKEQAAKNFLAGFTQEKWNGFDLQQRVKAIETVLQAVIIHPIPKGRSRRAPFDPSLIEVVFRKPS
ncbi:recombinase family protein [Streptomyces sp. NPDC056638]|uniref:recombinase family protein n=1 Tax=Streptomyces sp. NPDC056638 TaxID=3345887 RepID=UPI00368F36EE